MSHIIAQDRTKPQLLRKGQVTNSELLQTLPHELLPFLSKMASYSSYNPYSREWTNVSESRASQQRTKVYPHQVGGHGQIRQLLSINRLLKPMVERELEFYIHLNSPILPADLLWLRAFTPKFYGTEYLHIPLEEDEEFRLSPTAVNMVRRNVKKSIPYSQTGGFISLENLTSGFCNPCILDVKIGTRGYETGASKEKKERAIKKSKETTSYEYGVRFTGMQTFKNGLIQLRDKRRCQSLKRSMLRPELEFFFDNGKGIRFDVIAVMLQKLRVIRNEMARQKHFQLHSSSLLFLYEADSSVGESALVDVRMIDFAHVEWRKSGDSGYVKGADTVIRILDEIEDKK